MENDSSPSYSLRWQASPFHCTNCGTLAGWGIVGAKEIYHRLELLCDDCTMRLAPDLSKSLISIQVLRELGEMVLSEPDTWLDQLAVLLTFARGLHESCKWPLRLRFLENAADLGKLLNQDDEPTN